jgi:hypothetical protein
MICINVTGAIQIVIVMELELVANMTSQYAMELVQMPLEEVE